MQQAAGIGDAVPSSVASAAAPVPWSGSEVADRDAMVNALYKYFPPGITVEGPADDDAQPLPPLEALGGNLGTASSERVWTSTEMTDCDNMTAAMAQFFPRGLAYELQAETNDEGAVVTLGTNKYAHTGFDGSQNYYCGRFFGANALLRATDSWCGPDGGPQCASCQRFQASKAAATAEIPQIRTNAPGIGRESPPVKLTSGQGEVTQRPTQSPLPQAADTSGERSNQGRANQPSSLPLAASDSLTISVSTPASVVKPQEPNQEEPVRSASKLFAAMDTNNDGVVDMNEFKNAYASGAFQAPQPSAPKYGEEADNPGSYHKLGTLNITNLGNLAGNSEPDKSANTLMSRDTVQLDRLSFVANDGGSPRSSVVSIPDQDKVTDLPLADGMARDAIEMDDLRQIGGASSTEQYREDMFSRASYNSLQERYGPPPQGRTSSELFRYGPSPPFRSDSELQYSPSPWPSTGGTPWPTNSVGATPLPTTAEKQLTSQSPWPLLTSPSPFETQQSPYSPSPAPYSPSPVDADMILSQRPGADANAPKCESVLAFLKETAEVLPDAVSSRPSSQKQVRELSVMELNQSNEELRQDIRYLKAEVERRRSEQRVWSAAVSASAVVSGSK